MSSLEKASDGTVLFLPGRLDRDPTVFRGMTSDELFLVGGAGAAMGLPIGLFLMALTGETTALLASILLIGPGIAIVFGGGMIRRFKRGKPNTWIYRVLQYQLAKKGFPMGQGAELILRSGPWSIRRDEKHIQRKSNNSSSEK